NAEVVRRVLGGEHGAHRNIVVLNAAAGLLIAERVEDLHAGIAVAADSIDSGRAAAALATLARVSTEQAAMAAG
ncbi:MAG: anthranilate phosphoribosyltransferase, partial [Ilumatobacteraceae bacterium]|nr:anthranilate phosphoribosyltransferase [Ilumatobacteraceae bacterium]